MKVNLDMLLFPKSYYKKLTDRKGAVYAGIIFIGLADVFNTEIFSKVSNFIGGKQSGLHPAGILLLILSALLIGVIDTFVFARPMSDLFGFFKKVPPKESGANILKVMKIYISAHLVYVPLQILLNYLMPIGTGTPNLMIAIAAYIQIGMILWFSGIIARGINTLFEIDSPYNVAVFFAIFLWNFIWGIVLGTGISMWLGIVQKI